MEKPQRLCNSTFIAKTTKTKDGRLFSDHVVIKPWHRPNGGKLLNLFNLGKITLYINLPRIRNLKINPITKLSDFTRLSGGTSWRCVNAFA